MFEGIMGTIGTVLLAAFIIYLSYLSSKYIGKGLKWSSNSKYMRLVDQIPVGQNRTVAIVQVGSRYLVLGVASEQIQILSELEEEDLIPLAVESGMEQTPNFKELLSKLGRKGNGKI